MLQESIESIRRQVLTQLHTARKEGRTPESIKTAPHTYYHFLVAFMHQLKTSSNGVELFGIPLVIAHDVDEIAVTLS